VFRRNTRWWILCKSARIICAPFFQVRFDVVLVFKCFSAKITKKRFVDFFLADQFTSMVMALYDIVFGVCYCLGLFCSLAAKCFKLCFKYFPPMKSGCLVRHSNVFGISSNVQTLFGRITGLVAFVAGNCLCCSFVIKHFD
jgi:hypothetical protein